MSSAKWKNDCHYEFSYEGNIPNNLIIRRVPSKEKQDEFLRMTKISDFAELKYV